MLYVFFFRFMKLLVCKTRNQNKTSNAIEKKDDISVKCQLPACWQYGLPGEQVWICLRPAQWGPSWKMSRGPGLGFCTGTPWGQTDMAEDITFVTTFVGGKNVEQE